MLAKLNNKVRRYMLSAKKNMKIEKETYDNNLLFYTILKTLVQCKLSEQKMITFQSLANKVYQSPINNVENLKNALLSSDQIIKPDVATRNSYENLISLIDDEKASMWFSMIDVGIDLLLFKDLILQEAKAYTLTRQQETEREIVDHLSIEYDASNLCLPYGQRVLSSLLVFALTDTHRKSEFLLESSNQRVKQIYSKINELSDNYSINCNNMLTLIVNESINQSIVSSAGGSYEDRVEYMVKPLVSDWKGHSHDENIKAMEYDFTFSLNGKKAGISAKRTLRERYKQNHEDVEKLKVDYVFVFTLGTDLNEDKLKNLLQKTGTYVVVAQEIYNSKDYLKKNPRVLSSASFTHKTPLVGIIN